MSASRSCAAAGCCRWSTPSVWHCLACGFTPSPTGSRRRCSSIGWSRWATAYEALFYVLAASLFLRSYSLAKSPLQRQQLKWLYRGAWLAVGPFTLFFAIPFLLDWHPASLFTNLAGLSIVILPLTFSWAIVRYRLMDTDLIFKRGVAYTLATSLILGGYFGIIALSGLLVHNAVPETVRETSLVLTILVVAAAFDPLKRRIQSWVDRIFDRQRYDYRKALVEFGRGLSSETNLQALLESIVEQLPHTLLVERVAVFLAQTPNSRAVCAWPPRTA